MNKVLVKLYVPAFEAQFDVWLPLNRRIYNVTNMIVKAVDDLCGGNYNPKKQPILYDKLTAEPYNINLTIKEAGIKNSTEMVLI